jgi:hypothetical protein
MVRSTKRIESCEASANVSQSLLLVSDFAGTFQVTLDLSGTNLTLTLTLPMEPGSENNSS